ncbi:MAG: efflux RND transporter periplasmic adaptor subunit [Acidobacteriaceae bacterium]
MSAGVTRPGPPWDEHHDEHRQRRAGRWLVWIVIVIAVLVVALLVGWLPHQKRNEEVDAKARQQQNSVPVVEVQTVHGASAEQDLTLPGTVTPLRSAHIYAQASGFLKARYVDLGDSVRKGQLLGLISAPDLDTMVSQQAAMLQQSKDGVATAQAALRLQQATYDRVHTLVLHGILSQQDDDTALAAKESARSNLEAAENAVKAAQAAQAHARTLADFEQLRSPIDGTVTARNVEVGNFVSPAGAALGATPGPVAGATGGPPTGGAQGGELFDVVDLRSLEIFVAVPEQEAPFVQTGQPVNLTFSELPGQTFTGRVMRTSDSLSQQSRTLLAELQVNDAQHRLRPGMFASAQIHYRASNPGILVSGDSLFTLAQGEFVPVVENNIIQMRSVQVGRDLGTQLYITAGLKDGDLVVVSPNDLVKQGARVTTRPAPKGQEGGGG